MIASMIPVRGAPLGLSKKATRQTFASQYTPQRLLARRFGGAYLLAGAHPFDGLLGLRGGGAAFPRKGGLLAGGEIVGYRASASHSCVAAPAGGLSALRLRNSVVLRHSLPYKESPPQLPQIQAHRAPQP
jgi:hypothetical protein